MAKLSFHDTVRNALGPTLPQAIAELVDKPGLAARFLRGRKVHRELSNAELYAEMMRRAKQLRALGLQKGDRVAFVIPETDDFVLTFLGAFAAGIVPVPMYPPLSFGKLDAYVDTAERIMRASGAKMLLTDNRMQSILWSLVSKVSSLEALHTMEKLDKIDIRKTDIDINDVGREDVAFLQYTSGSTSMPKGVVVSHGSLLANLDGIMNAGLQIQEDDIAVSWLPLYHDMGLIGLVLAPMWFGVPTTYIPTLDFVKQPSLWMETMSTYAGSISFAPNFAFALAVKRTRDEKLETMDLSRVRAIGCGAEPNHPETLRMFVDYFGQAGMPSTALMPAYGMAEATLAITFHELQAELKTDVIDADRYEAEGVAYTVNLEDDTEVRVGENVSCGKPFPGHEVLVVNEQFEELPERHVGQIIVRGPSVAPRYHEEPEKTAETFRDLGLVTGDLGYIADGELYVTGRLKDIVILNGRNYDPHAIEWAVQDVVGMRKGNVVAFSIPGAQTEELVVVGETKDDVDLDALRDVVLQRINEELFLVPADVVLVGKGQLPKTSSGKLQRAKTRAQYLDGSLGAEGVRTFGASSDRVTLAKHVTRSAVSKARHRVRRGASVMMTRINPLSRG
jgi:fatty-acyl-CoA synthase